MFTKVSQKTLNIELAKTNTTQYKDVSDRDCSANLSKKA